MAVPETIEGVVLDHVAHAVHHWGEVWGRYATDLGAEWNSGGPGAGFAPGQVRFGNGARVELLMPYDTAVNDFLERFLRSNGPGPHHLTFKVADIGSAIEQARRSGWEPIGIDLSDPEWMEAFLHPKQATGVVVQLAQAPGGGWTSPPPDDYPSDRRRRRMESGRSPRLRCSGSRTRWPTWPTPPVCSPIFWAAKPSVPVMIAGSDGST